MLHCRPIRKDDVLLGRLELAVFPFPHSHSRLWFVVFSAHIMTSVSAAPLAGCAVECLFSVDFGNCDRSDAVCACKSPEFVQAFTTCFLGRCPTKNTTFIHTEIQAVCNLAGATIGLDEIPLPTLSSNNTSSHNTKTSSSHSSTSSAHFSSVQPSSIISASTSPGLSSSASATNGANNASNSGAPAIRDHGSISLNVRTLAGGVTGGVLFVVLVGFCIFIRMRHLRKQTRPPEDVRETPAGTIYPYNLSLASGNSISPLLVGKNVLTTFPDGLSSGPAGPHPDNVPAPKIRTTLPLINTEQQPRVEDGSDPTNQASASRNDSDQFVHAPEMENSPASSPISPPDGISPERAPSPTGHTEMTMPPPYEL